MEIAFLGTGRMGTELALHLIKDHDVVAWNRTADRAGRVAEAGASIASTPQEAVRGRCVVVTSLFGPETVRDVVIAPELVSEGTTWVDSTTIGPDDAEEFAVWSEARGVRYVHTPVVGTIGPARAGTLGVYVGGSDAETRQMVAELVAPWADPTRLALVETAKEAATGKLLANLALGVSMQGLVEAIRLGRSQGLPDDRIIAMLDKTGFGFIAGMKGARIGARDFENADFTVDALAKDLRLMVRSSDAPLPMATAALESFQRAQMSDHGSWDISGIVAPELDEEPTA